MSISIQVPKSAKLIRTVTTFSAVFNADPAYLGMYNFGYGTTNQNITVLQTKRGSTYLISRASISGNITGDQFNESLQSAYIPYLQLKRIVGGTEGENVYQKPVPVNGYFQEQPFTAFFGSDKEGDGIKANFSGILNQTVNLIGVASISLYLNLSIYEINESEYNKVFRSKDETIKGIF